MTPALFIPWVIARCREGRRRFGDFPFGGRAFVSAPAIIWSQAVIKCSLPTPGLFTHRGGAQLAFRLR